MNWKYLIALLLIGSLVTQSCESDSKTKTTQTAPPVQKKVKIPAFNGDNAYANVKKQVDFGPRVPGTDEHAACKDWLVSELESQGADVIVQDFIANIHTGDRWQSYNIIGQINPEQKKRVILAAHWDTRFIAEEDNNKDKQKQPILGADDGGSGVGVLLEIARITKENPIQDIGIDIILFDAEDQGKRGPEEPPNLWCLGSQYWSKNKHKNGYRAKYGILLDMVGGKDPYFGKDLISKEYAGVLQEKIWKLAHGMGYSDMFSMNETGQLVDDHYFVNTIAGIPMIDIINYTPGQEIGFADHWHTHGDDMSAINKRTLKAVGQIVTAAIYKESGNAF